MAEKKDDATLSIAAQAWNATKDDGDPEYRGSAELEFWNEIDFRAQKVQETGTAITNFEKEVQKLDAEDKQKQAAIGGPMAVHSGHVPTDKEKAVVAREEAKAPKHP